MNCREFIVIKLSRIHCCEVVTNYYEFIVEWRMHDVHSQQLHA